jgi:hypothetical protein
MDKKKKRVQSLRLERPKALGPLEKAQTHESRAAHTLEFYVF